MRSIEQPDIYPDRKIPLLDSYSLPVTCLTHIRTSCLMMKHPPNTLQRYLSTVLLQDFAQLIIIGQTHISFDHAVFKTDSFLKYKETMVTFCSTSANPLSKLMKAILPELSSQVTSLHSDNNCHQKPCIYFLRSNFCQINDNFTTTLRITM